MSDITVVDHAHVVSSIAAALARVLNRDTAGITEDTRLFDDLGLDSTAVLELLMQLEDELGLVLDTDNLEQRHFETVGTLAEFLRTQDVA